MKRNLLDQGKGLKLPHVVSPVISCNHHIEKIDNTDSRPCVIRAHSVYRPLPVPLASLAPPAQRIVDQVGLNNELMRLWASLGLWSHTFKRKHCTKLRKC